MGMRLYAGAKRLRLDLLTVDEGQHRFLVIDPDGNQGCHDNLLM
jgi:hypothetical protein